MSHAGEIRRSCLVDTLINVLAWHYVVVGFEGGVLGLALLACRGDWFELGVFVSDGHVLALVNFWVCPLIDRDRKILI